MLKIRGEQVRAFEEHARRAFEDEMVRHLGDYAPRLCAVAGEPSVRRAVRLGVERARGHGLTNRGPVRLYLELMALYGAGFATDPLLPWATAVLGDAGIDDQAERADRLHEQATRYLDAVAGPDGRTLVEGLRRVAGARVEDYLTPGGDHERQAVAALRALYPRRCELAGKAGLRAAVRGGIERAARYPGAGERGVALFVALPLALGHGYADDPFYPWVAQTLEDPRIADPAARVARLDRRARTYLGEALAYLEQPSHAV